MENFILSFLHSCQHTGNGYFEHLPVSYISVTMFPATLYPKRTYLNNQMDITKLRLILKQIKNISDLRF